jgi:cytochrome c-type biogenesis protein CcmH
MMVWIAAAILAAICVAVLLNTLLRARAADDSRSAFDLTVYRDQLTEIDRDLDRGLLNEVQAKSARLEIERRMLASAATEENTPASGSGAEETKGVEETRRATRLAAMALTVALPLLAAGLYLHLGSPGQPAIPFAERRALQETFQHAMDDDLAAKIGGLEKRVEAQRFDAHSWLLLAEAYGELNRFIDAANAFRRAIELGAKEPGIYASLGEILVAAGGGEVGPEARRAFAEAITLDPENMKALYYSGLALAQDGRLQNAIRIWHSLVQRSGPQTPWRPLLQQRIAQLEAAIAAQPDQGAGSDGENAQSDAAMPQPSPEDIEAASRMSEADRSAFIRAMVERLAQRLEDQPSDLKGWLRLARAYSVLQQPEKATEALARASRAFAGQPEEAQAEAEIARARSELGL